MSKIDSLDASKSYIQRNTASTSTANILPIFPSVVECLALSITRTRVQVPTAGINEKLVRGVISSNLYGSAPLKLS